MYTNNEKTRAGDNEVHIVIARWMDVESSILFCFVSNLDRSKLFGGSFMCSEGRSVIDGWTSENPNSECGA